MVLAVMWVHRFVRRTLKEICSCPIEPSGVCSQGGGGVGFEGVSTVGDFPSADAPDPIVERAVETRGSAQGDSADQSAGGRPVPPAPSPDDSGTADPAGSATSAAEPAVEVATADDAADPVGGEGPTANAVLTTQVLADEGLLTESGPGTEWGRVAESLPELAAEATGANETLIQLSDEQGTPNFGAVDGTTGHPAHGRSPGGETAPAVGGTPGSGKPVDTGDPLGTGLPSGLASGTRPPVLPVEGAAGPVVGDPPPPGVGSAGSPGRFLGNGSRYRRHIDGRSTHVARPVELDRIRELYDAEKGSTIIFTGPPGMGKSFLLEAASQDPTLQTRYLQMNANERDWPLSGLSTLFALLPGDMAPEMAELLEDPIEPLFSIASKLLRSVRELRLTRMMLLIDDLDLMDPDSLRVVGFVARRLSETVLRVVATASELPVAGPLAGLMVHHLEPLPWREMVAIGFDVAGRQGVPAVVHGAATTAAGNPLAMTEAVANARIGNWGRADPVVMPMRLGPGTRDALAGELDGLSASARRALELASTAALTPMGLVGEVGLPALNELEHVGLVERSGNWLSIVDPRVRSVVYWQLPSHARLRLHEEMLALTEPVDHRVALWHRSFGTDHPAGPELLDGAVSLLAEGAVGPAMELIERNLTLHSLDGESADLLLAAAERLLQLGEVASVNRLVDLAALVGNDSTRKLRVAVLRVRGAFIERQEILDGVARTAIQLHGHSDPSRAVALMDHMAFAFTEMLHLIAARSWWRDAEERIGEVGPELASHHRRVGEMISVFESTAHGQPSCTGGPPEDEPAPNVTELLLVARGLTYSERYLDARATFSVIANDARITPLLAQLTTLYALDNELQAGNLYKATQYAHRVIGTESTAQTHVAYRAHLLARYWMVKGRMDLAESYVDVTRRLASTTFGASLSARSHALTGAANLLRGHFIDAVRQLTQADQIGGQVANPYLLCYQGNLIEALVRIGRLDEAIGQQERFEQQLAKYPSQWGTLVVGRCRALVMSGNRSLTAFRRHLSVWPRGAEGHVYPFEYARTLISFGERLAEYGDKAESLDTLSRAVSMLDDIGHLAYATMLRQRFLGSTPPMAPVEHAALARLTPNERLVAEKVVSGMRNRDIAEELFVSVRTVEVRLTGIYRKLGVRSRSELMALSAHSEENG